MAFAGTAADWKEVADGKRLREALEYLQGRLLLRDQKTREKKTAEVGGAAAIARDHVFCLVQGCSKTRDLCVGASVFSLLRRRCRSQVAAAIGDPLIHLFASHGRLSLASSVFLSIRRPSSHSWHAIISAHVAHACFPEALSLYHSMLSRGVLPTTFVASSIIKACIGLRSLLLGMALHHHVVECELEAQVVVGTALIALYSSSGFLGDACCLLDALPSRNVVTWNTIIAGCARHGDGLLAWELFERMRQGRFEPDGFTYSCVLKACGIMESLSRGESVHRMITRGGESMMDTAVGNALIDMYSRCACAGKAQEVFESMKSSNSVSWNTLMNGYAQHGHSFDALELFARMQEDGIRPNKVTFLSLLKACGSLAAKEEGRWAHNQAIVCGFVTDIEIGSALVDMYAHCRSLIDACGVFDKLSDRDCVLFSTIISACVHHGQCSTALELFAEMKEGRIKPDKVTLLCIVKACSSMKELRQGRLVHEQISDCGLAFDVVVRNALIDMYVKCGSFDEARKVFDDFPNRNMVSWNTMIAGYAHAELGYPALEVFEKMLLDNSDPDNATFLCALKASGGIGATVQGRLIHDMLNRKGYDNDSDVGNSLVDMYAKCGSIDDATRAFKLLPCHNLASWGALISGYAQQGKWELADEHLEEMQQEGLKPTGIIYTSMLAACCQAGEVKEGHRQFASMSEDFVPILEHYNCMIDLLGRSGNLREAERLLGAMPTSPDVSSWMSLLTSCKTYGNIKLGTECYEEIVKLDPDNGAALSLMLELSADCTLYHTFLES